MGDRWSYPHQASAATYMWMPLQVEGTKISIPEYWQAWDIQTLRPLDILKEAKILSYDKITLPTDWKRKNGQIISDRRGSKMEIKFKGTHAALVGEANPHCGYAKISIVNHKKDTVYSSLVDFYSQYPETAVRIITPRMPKDRYTLCVEVTGISPVWTDKTKRIYGSKGSLVCINQLCIFEK